MEGFDVIVDASGTYGNHNYSGEAAVVFNVIVITRDLKDLEVCQHRVRESLAGVETSCTPSLTSGILTSCPDTRGHRVRAPGEEVKVA